MLYTEYPLFWTQDVIDKIQYKHGINPEEVKEVIFDTAFYLRRGKKGTHIVIGKTFAGKHMFIALKKIGRGRYKVLTARPLGDKEIKQFKKEKLYRAIKIH